MFAMVTVPQNNAFKRHFDLCQCIEQDVDSFSADDLAGEKDEVALAEGADLSFSAPAANRHMDLNPLRIESVAEQFVLGILGINDEALATLIEANFFSFSLITDPFYGKTSGVVPGHECEAREDAIKGSGAGTGDAGEVIVFISAHAVHPVIVDHAHEWQPGVEQGLHDLEIIQVMNIDKFWLKLPHDLAHGLAIRLSWEHKPGIKSFSP